MAVFSFTKYLPHTGVISGLSTNQFGDVSATSPSTSPCFYYYGQRLRSRGGNVSEELLRHYLLLPSTAVVAQDYTVSGIVDSDGASVAPTAKVSRVERFTHWRHGVQLIQCVLDFN